MQLFLDLFLISWHGAFKWLILGTVCLAITRVPIQAITFGLKNVVVAFFIPLLIFYKTIEHLTPERMLILPQYCLWAFIFLGLAEVTSRLLSKCGVPKDSQPTFHLGNTFHNYGFVAYGLVETLHGPALLSELFAFVIFAEIALWTRGRAFLSKGKFDLNIIIRNPPLWAFITAILLIGIGWTPFGKVNLLDQGVAFFTQWTVPAALFGLGGVMYHQKDHFRLPKFLQKEIYLSLLLRHLILPPLLCLLVLSLTQGNLQKALLIEAVMPCSLMTMTLAKIYGGKPESISLMAFGSQVLSFITIPIWLMCFH